MSFGMEVIPICYRYVSGTKVSVKHSRAVTMTSYETGL